MTVRTRDYKIDMQISYYYYKTLDDLLKGVQQNLLIFKSKQFEFNKNYNQPYHDLIIGIPDDQINNINIPQLLIKINDMFGDYKDNIIDFSDIKAQFMCSNTDRICLIQWMKTEKSKI